MESKFHIRDFYTWPNILNVLKKKLAKIASFEIQPQIKNLEKIILQLKKDHKINKNSLFLHEILDFQIVVPRDELCYEVLGTIHSYWTPLQGMIEDHILNSPYYDRKYGLYTKVIGKDGGYIFAPTNTITMETPLENILAIYEVATGKDL